MITITVVRHGESTDNLRPVWAGWTDAPLSNHGMNQAKALGASFKDTKLDDIFASPLKRALWTAQQIEKQNESTPKPSFTISPLLREQHFGEAEGGLFGTEEGGWHRLPGRVFKFPDGETLDDVRARANEAVAEFIDPILREQQGKPASERHIVFVAHGIFNHEFLGALLARRPEGIESWMYRGMTNTGWTRLVVGYEGETPDQPTPNPAVTDPYFAGAPPLSVTVHETDVTAHLDGVHRQKGGIGSSGFDEKQQEIRKFFSGAGSD